MEWRDLRFAALATENAKSGRLAEDLEKAIMDEFERLTGKAEEHWEHGGDRHKAIAAIYQSSFKKANQAMKQHEYCLALELARAADALAHGKQHGSHRLVSGKERLKLSPS